MARQDKAGLQMSISDSILIHADAGAFEGWGHLRESLEVARTLRNLGRHCVLVLPEGVSAAQEEARASGFEVIAIPVSDWQENQSPEQIIRALKSDPRAALVSDLLKITPAYGNAIIESHHRWATITELREDELAPINFNISKSPEYVPLSDPYRQASAHVIQDSIRQVLVCFGGSDPSNVTGKALEWIRAAIEKGRLPGVSRIVVVLGPLFADHESICAAAATYPAEIDLRRSLSPIELAHVASESDLAVTTSGGTMYEFCALGVPCIVVPVLPKHILNARVLKDRQAVLLTRQFHHVTAEEITMSIDHLSAGPIRARMSQAAQREIDGMGASRIADRLVTEWGI
jgi:spore coat polysaccharide biosynthesis predicted glycosyltransferase SpsG